MEVFAMPKDISTAKNFQECIECFNYQKEHPEEFTDCGIQYSMMRLSLVKALLLTTALKEIEEIITLAEAEKDKNEKMKKVIRLAREKANTIPTEIGK